MSRFEHALLTAWVPLPSSQCEIFSAISRKCSTEKVLEAQGPLVCCTRCTLQPTREDGRYLKQFGPYFLPLSAKMRFTASVQCWAVLLQHFKEWQHPGQSGAGSGCLVCPDNQEGAAWKTHV